MRGALAHPSCVAQRARATSGCWGGGHDRPSPHRDETYTTARAGLKRDLVHVLWVSVILPKPPKRKSHCADEYVHRTHSRNGPFTQATLIATLSASQNKGPDRLSLALATTHTHTAGAGRSKFALRVRRRADWPQGGQLGLVHYGYRSRQRSRRKKVDPSSPYSQSARRVTICREVRWALLSAAQPQSAHRGHHTHRGRPPVPRFLLCRNPPSFICLVSDSTSRLPCAEPTALTHLGEVATHDTHFPVTNPADRTV